MLQKTILEPSEDSISKRSTPSVSLKRKVRGNAAGSLGFGRCPSAAHAGHSNSRRTLSRTSGRARLRTGIPPCSGAHNCYGYCERPSSGSMSMVSGHLCHCSHHSRQVAFRPLSIRQPHYRVGQVRVVLSPQEKSEPRSSLSGQTGIVSLGVSLASGL